MLVFKKITMQNFLSVGNKPISLNLNADNITLIVGENGQGKSCISGEALFYALYGKSFRKVSLSDLINTTNKSNLLVTLDFSSGANDYRIVRGIKPNVFEIYINGKLKKQLAAVKDYQEYLVKNILKMDEKTFKQLVIIGSSSYIPFMKLTTSDRRIVIENLLNIDVFSQLGEKAKQEYKDVASSQHEIEANKEKLEYEIKILEGKKKEQKDTSSVYIQQIDNEIKSLEDEKNRLKDEILSLQKDFASDDLAILVEKFNSKKSLYNKIIQLRERIVLKMESLEKQLKFFRNTTVCPTCNTELTPEYINGKKSYYENEIQACQKNLEEFDRKKDNFYDAINQISSKIDELNKINSSIKDVSRKVSSILRNIQSLEAQKASILENKNSRNEEYDEEILKYQKQIEEIETSLDDVRDRIDALSYVISLCNDSGVKASIIREYIPVINAKIQNFLDIVNFSVKFSFDEQFRERIAWKNKSLEYNNFSEGEKLRIDLAIMFAFREISALRNSISTNILIGDEADHGTLDAGGFEAFCNILLSLKNTNIFLISHTADQISGIANKILSVEKINGFTHINVEK